MTGNLVGDYSHLILPSEFFNPHTTMGEFFQKSFLYVLGLSIGTLSIGIGLGFYGATFTTVVEGLLLDTATKKAAFNALAPVGAVFGASSVPIVMNRFGRRFPAMAASSIVVLGWTLIVCTSQKVTWIAYLGRVVNGIGLGACSSINPVYIAELSPASVRGAYGVMSQLFTTVGSLVVYGMAIFCPWRTVAGVAIAFPLITVIALFFVPESPRVTRQSKLTPRSYTDAESRGSWTNKKTSRKEKKRRENCINSSDESTSSEKKEVNKESLDITEYLMSLKNDKQDEEDENGTQVVGEKDRLFQKKYARGLFFSLLVVFFQQFSGINALMSNLTAIFDQSHVALKPSVASTVVITGKVVTTALSSPLQELLGRRGAWMLSSGFQAIFLIISCFNERGNWSPVLPIVMLFGDVVAFGVGLGPIPWYVVPELFPDSVRGTATGLVQGANWFLAGVMIFAFPVMLERMTLAWTYFFYGAVMVVSFLFGLLLLPETRNAEMGAALEEK
ncbi:sugar transporter [Tritrichomonas foetus]|uniref:Sugar transporter n=1 Tax=Tritrichomonas foetus TaxID=1144522 RepID=A0A1J4KZA2_9EUKA|nr:sugar transporter [Tritrichomonas foetus]|eukprot:OHT16579.1 sugar transporter [Tritrichomonas foetus]